MCNGAVRFVRANDPGARIGFAPLASPEARAALAPFGREPGEFESVVLVDAHGVHAGAAGALRIAHRLRAPWPLFARTAELLPPGAREAVYRWIARNRYRWFGRSRP